MFGLKTLIKMQLKEKVDLSWTKRKKSIITKVVFTILGFVAVTAIVYLLLFLSKYLQLFSLVGVIPSSVIALVFGIMMIVFSISCAFGLSKSLYFSKDNFMLLVMPVEHNVLYLSKIIVYYVYELIKNSMFLLPFFVGYGLFTSQSLIYYPWILFCFFFVCAIPVLLGAILSIPIMYISKLFKSYKVLQYIGYISICLIIVFAVVKAISLIPADIDLLGTWGTTYWKIQSFLSEYVKIFAPLYYLTSMIIGTISVLGTTLFSLNTLIYFAILIGILIAMFFICFFSARPLFFKMASQPFEFKRNSHAKEEKNKKSPLFLSLLKKEFMVNTRSSEVMYNHLTIVFGLPIAMFLLNKIFGAMNTGTLGNTLVLSFNILILLLIALNSNFTAASVYSKDGRAGYLNKIQPTNYSVILFSRIFYKLILNIASICASCIIVSVFSKFDAITTILFTLAMCAICTAHLFWSAELDIMNPQNEQYAESSSLKNPNETKSTIYSFLVAFIMFGITFFLIPEGNLKFFIKVFVVAGLILIYKIYTYFEKIRLYYKEK